MAEPHFPDPVLLVAAVFSRHSEALAWGRQRLEELYGRIVLSNQVYHFNQTAFYEPTMGPGLQKQFLVFDNLLAADRLPEVKLRTNALEEQLAHAGPYGEARPLNVDPGVLTLGKFMLATTKDQAHRIYLRDGIYAEVTLRFQDGAFEPWPWTYADYRLSLVRAFLKEARDFYRGQLAKRQRKQGEIL